VRLWRGDYRDVMWGDPSEFKCMIMGLSVTRLSVYSSGLGWGKKREGFTKKEEDREQLRGKNKNGGVG